MYKPPRWSTPRQYRHPFWYKILRLSHQLTLRYSPWTWRLSNLSITAITHWFSTPICRPLLVWIKVINILSITYITWSHCISLLCDDTAYRIEAPSNVNVEQSIMETIQRQNIQQNNPQNNVQYQLQYVPVRGAMLGSVQSEFFLCALYGSLCTCFVCQWMWIW